MSVRIGSTVNGAGRVINTDNSTLTGTGLVVRGDNNRITGSGLVVYGDNNRIVGPGATVHGDNNIITGPGASGHGDNNIILGPGASFTGDNNRINGARHRGQRAASSARTARSAGIVIDGTRVVVNGRTAIGRMDVTGGSVTTTFTADGIVINTGDDTAPPNIYVSGSTGVRLGGGGLRPPLPPSQPAQPAARAPEPAPEPAIAYPEPWADEPKEARPGRSTCVACTDREACVITRPCNHINVCVGCVRAADPRPTKCWTCRREATSFERVFDAGGE